MQGHFRNAFTERFWNAFCKVLKSAKTQEKSVQKVFRKRSESIPESIPESVSGNHPKHARRGSLKLFPQAWGGTTSHSRSLSLSPSLSTNARQAIQEHIVVCAKHSDGFSGTHKNHFWNTKEWISPLMVFAWLGSCNPKP